MQPYLDRDTEVFGQGVFICPASPRGTNTIDGYSKPFTYSMNYQFSGDREFKMTEMDSPADTIFMTDTDGWDSCLYPDEHSRGNVLYRHSGGSEDSGFFLLGGQKINRSRDGFGTANSAFFDGHVETIKRAPIRLFSLRKVN